jgi:hypothetical protein
MSDLKSKPLMQLYRVFPLSAHGVTKLSMYSHQALEYGLSQASKCLWQQQPFEYLENLIKIYEKGLGLQPNWGEYNARREALAISQEDTEFIDPTRLEFLRQSKDEEAQPVFKPRIYEQHYNKHQHPYIPSNVLYDDYKKHKQAAKQEPSQEEERARWGKIIADMKIKHGEQGPSSDSFEYFTWQMGHKYLSPRFSQQ